MSKYTGISIGPIVKTLSIARKPRELWSASYMFSHLMSCIISALPKSAVVVSPAKLQTKKNSVGLYPDRLFFKGDGIVIQEVIAAAFDKFQKETNLNITTIRNYFNVMSITDCVSNNSDSEAVNKLNRKLDVIELCSRPISSDAIIEVSNLIKNVYTSSLFKVAFDENKFPIGTLGEIATYELKKDDEKSWNEAKDSGQLIERMNEQLPADYKIFEEDNFYQSLKALFWKKYKSYHKYICIVQADGDNMGKVVSNVPDNKLQDLSESLLNFGTSACEKIKTFGGLPIYAGGDDLLFIAPVKSFGDKTIFDLLVEIDSEYKMIEDKVESYELEEKGQKLLTSMSYGLSITYYKYPLYEALETARNLLFIDAKTKVTGKNAVAWNLQRHSGSSFCGRFSKTGEIYSHFKEIVSQSVDDNIVSAVAHKIRHNESLLEIVRTDKEHVTERVDAFYKKIMEIEAKNPQESQYLEATKTMLLTLFKQDGSIDDIVKTMYGMLCTAKFINGEEDKHE